MYPAFNLMNSCVKCGDSWVLWQPGFDKPYKPLEPLKEYLLRTCNRCGYSWKERVEDRPKEYYEGVD